MSWKRLLPGIGSALLVMALADTSCMFLTNSEFTDFQVKVDSLTVPASIVLHDSLHIQLHGTIGPTGCYTFSKIEDEQEDHCVTLTVWGAENEGASSCTQAVVELHEWYSLLPAVAGYFYIQVSQPDESIFLDSVNVTGPGG